MASKIRVKREEFLGRLQSAQPGLSQREVVDQSHCFVFLPGEIVTYNDEVSCRVPFDKYKDFEGAVQAKPLIDILAKLPEDEVELEMIDGEFLVHGTRRRSGIRMERDILMTVSAVEKPGKWKKLPEQFAEALEIVSACAASDTNQFVLTCVHFHPDYLEAMDNVQMARYTLETGIKTECVVRRDALKQVVTFGMTEVSETEAWLHFRNASGLVLSCRLYQETYIDLSKILDVEDAVPCVLPGGLAEEVDRAQIFSKENTDEKVKVQLRPGKIRIKGTGASGWFEAVKKLKYDGPSLEFLIAPKLLSELANKHNECQIAPKRLRVVGERYVYVSCLFETPEEGVSNGKAEPTAKEEE